MMKVTAIIPDELVKETQALYVVCKDYRSDYW